jgi:hypothetical protein
VNEPVDSIDPEVRRYREAEPCGTLRDTPGWFIAIDAEK